MQSRRKWVQTGGTHGDLKEVTDFPTEPGKILEYVKERKETGNWTAGDQAKLNKRLEKLLQTPPKGYNYWKTHEAKHSDYLDEIYQLDIQIKSAKPSKLLVLSTSRIPSTSTSPVKVD